MPVPEEGHPLDERVRAADHHVDPAEHEVGVVTGRVQRAAIVGSRHAGRSSRCRQHPVDRVGNGPPDPGRTILRARTETGAPEQPVDHRRGHRRQWTDRAAGAGARRWRSVQSMALRTPRGALTVILPAQSRTALRIPALRRPANALIRPFHRHASFSSDLNARVIDLPRSWKSPVGSSTSYQTIPASSGIAVA